MNTKRIIRILIASALFACGGEPETAEPDGEESFTIAECKAAGGIPVADPGDGSSQCERRRIGYLKLGIEGGVCCEP